VTAEAHIAKRGRTISLGEFEVRQADRLVAKGCAPISTWPGKNRALTPPLTPRPPGRSISWCSAAG